MFFMPMSKIMKYLKLAPGDFSIKKSLLFILPSVAVICANVYLRTYPVNFPQLKTQAKKMVEKSIEEEAKRQVFSKFPQFNQLAKRRLIKEQVREIRGKRKKDIETKTEEWHNQLKDRYQDATGHTYLMELDCWHWARYVENVVKLGHPGDEVIKGRQFDTHMLSPSGQFMSWGSFLFYSSALLYKVFNFFRPTNLFNFLFLLPLLFMAALTLVVYIFAYRLGGHICAVVSALFVGTAPIFLPRSCAGWFDKDILNLIFPVLIIWTYLLAYDAKSIKKGLSWILFSAFWTGLFCFTWENWWFIVPFIIMYEVVYFIAIAFAYWKSKVINTGLLKKRGLFLGVFFGACFFWILVLSGPQPLIALWDQVNGALALNKPLITTIWPNVYSTVGELKPTTLRELHKGVGNGILFWGSLLAWDLIFFWGIFKKKFHGFKRGAVIFLSLWLFSMLFACLKGVRFVVFLIIPLGIFLGWLIKEFYELLKRKTRKYLAIGGLIIAMVSLTVVFLSHGHKAAGRIYPLMDDTWHQVLVLMRDKLPKDAVINSWWDFGDWFKVVSRRRVIFDGQSQNIPQAYWMAKAMLSEDEEETIRILRMLNNGGNKAFEIINEYLKEPTKSILLLESVLIAPDLAKARSVLLEFVPVAAANEVMRLVFEPPKSPAYFVVDTSLPFKMGAISFLGNWNFLKVYIAQNLNRMERKKIIEYLIKLGRDKEEVERLYQEAFLIPSQERDNWISSPQQFYSPLIRGELRGDTVFFENGYTYKPKTQSFLTNEQKVCRSLFVFRKDHLVEVVYTNASQGFSALVTDFDQNYKMVLLDPPLGRSIFTRLYYLRGDGLRHFQSFIDAQVGNEYTRVFRVVW
jgi:dolichyl-diphosphooligosaccharide--protein glycosyltransferase